MNSFNFQKHAVCFLSVGQVNFFLKIAIKMSFIRQSLNLNLCKTISQRSSSVFHKNICHRKLLRLYCTNVAIPHPTADGDEKSYSSKVTSIVEEITKLTLIEVADLNECLKKKLNIKDMPMTMGFAPMAAAAPAEDEEAEAQVTKTSFTVKLLKFDDTKKVAVIKEVKNHIEGMNLVQAKKFVESAPQVLKADIAKDEADNLKKLLEAVGATCEIV